MVLLSLKKDSDDLIYDANFELLKQFGKGDTNYLNMFIGKGVPVLFILVREVNLVAAISHFEVAKSYAR